MKTTNFPQLPHLFALDFGVRVDWFCYSQNGGKRAAMPSQDYMLSNIL